ncbi:amino acid permease [Lacibacter luteus]|uniref:Amino acid permease n=1 Tax=Lacibacter luteus TaxID=2508719 RepID=A0A4Q1CE69_9BACT|nr:amino acid permease [Lacibacter luteus]RXK58061.1 amino acid permease [Lacibacter luteus]
MGRLFRKKKINTIVAEGGDEVHGGTGLHRVLNVRDLTFLGIAAVIGAGIFSTIGSAAFHGGPGVSLLFVITAVTCGFSALCYAEFASRVPVSGSAYTYAYVSFGELVAWIIGWALILEYAIGNIVVAISWSSYFNNLLQGLNIHLPYWLTTNLTTANEALAAVNEQLAKGAAATADMQAIIDGYNAAPALGSSKLFLNLPAFLIVALITALAYIGMKESKKSANAMVIFKIAVIIFVIVMGFFYVNTDNWNPFMPNGFTGVLQGVSAVFYAYIGFDAISTTAEECKDPQRDLPKGMMNALVICTILYILIALVLTGMVNYSELKVDDPLAYVFDNLGLKWIGYIISISAVVATTSVLLVFQLGQPRIWMTMSRDGLLPKRFSKVHPKYKTPAFATIITGFLVGIPAMFLPSSIMTDLTSIGTLFAFVLVCLGVLLLPKLQAGTQGKFKLPYVNGQFILPLLVAAFIFLFRDRVAASITNLFHENHQEVLFLIFILIAVVIAALTFIRKYSLIPVLGALSCMYLMIEIPVNSWFWFFVWMGIGLVIYFFYGYRKSKLANEQA